MARLLYVLGSAGWSMVDRVIVTFALFYYLPPAASGLPVLVEERTVLGLTVFGAAMMAGRIVDAIADPLVASWSDRSRARLGRRRVFLAWSSVPLAAATTAVFFPPVPVASLANAVYLALSLSAFFVIFTLYAVPYLALIPELAHDAAGRIHLTTQQAFALLLGAAVVMIGTPVVIGALGADPSAYRMAIALTCAVAAVLLLAPVLGVRETPFESQPSAASPPPPKLVESLRLTLRNRPFLWYLGGNVAYWFGFNIIATGALYFTTVLMQAGPAFQGVALAMTFAVAALFFPIWNIVGRKLGKRRAQLAAGVAFVIALPLFAFISSKTMGLLAFALAGIPVSALLVLPNAMLADCVDLDARRTGTRREAMYFGAQGFLLKVNLGLSSAVLAALAGAFGRDIGHDLGVRLAGPVAAAVVVLGMVCYARYPETEVTTDSALNTA